MKEEVKKIIAAIKKGEIAPIYFLMGEEPYFIDIVSDYIENNLLQEDQKGFDQLVLYGQDVTVPAIIDYARRFPMIAERQVIIIKEAQKLKATIDQLVPYVENPTPSTVLVFCYKYEKLDARKKLTKTLEKHKACVLVSDKLKEYQIASWLPDVVKKKHLLIQPKAIQMLVDFLGNDLSRIQNEIDKLALIIAKNSEITPDVIEQNIGISKDFNNYELKSAFATKDEIKVMRIIKHFGDNPTDNPIVVTLSVLYTFFQKLLAFHGLTDQSDKAAATALKENAFFIKEYRTAAQLYPMKKVSAIINGLRTIDVKSKGVGTANASQADLLKDLVTLILR